MLDYDLQANSTVQNMKVKKKNPRRIGVWTQSYWMMIYAWNNHCHEPLWSMQLELEFLRKNPKWRAAGRSVFFLFLFFFSLRNKKALSLPVWVEWYCPRQKGPHRPSYSCSTRLLGVPSYGRDGEQNQGNCSARVAISVMYIGFAWQSWRKRGRKGGREKRVKIRE